MFKKILSFIVLTVITVLTYNMTVNASFEYDVSWSNYNYYDTYYGLKGEGNLPQGTTGFTLALPLEDILRTTANGINATISFSDSTGNLGGVDLVDYMGYVDFQNITIDLLTLGFETATGFIILIPHNEGGSLPSGYATYIEDNYSLEYYYSRDFSVPVYWINDNIYSTYYAMKARIFTPTDFISCTLTIPVTDYNSYSFGGQDSYISFYDNTDTLLTTIDLEDLYDASLSTGIINIYYEKDLEVLGINQTQVTYFYIFIMQSYDVLPTTQYVSYFNENTERYFNTGTLHKITYYNLGSIYYTGSFIDLPTAPTAPTPPSGFVFSGWFFADGTKYNDTVLDSDTILYSRFQLEKGTGYIDQEPTADTDDNLVILFTGLGFNDVTGYVLIWVLIILVITVLCLLVKIPSILICILNMLITGLFTYLGLLPVIAIILSYAIFTVGIIWSIISGGKEYE